MGLPKGCRGSHLLRSFTTSRVEMFKTLNLTVPPGPLSGNLATDRIRNHSDTGKNGHNLKSALDYHTGARISSLEGQMPEHTKPLLSPGSGSFIFCVDYEFRRKTCSKATRTSLLVVQWPLHPQKGLGMQLKEEVTGLKGAFLPFFSVLCRLGGFPLSRGNLVW